MKKGEFSRFLFEPQYAYGDLGCPPLIPAFSVVLYEVHILDFLDSGQVDDFIAMSQVRRCWERIIKCSAEPFEISTSRKQLIRNNCNFYFIFECFCWNIGVTIRCFSIFLQDEQNTAPLSNLLAVVSTVRSFGNRCFNQSRYHDAKDHYKKVDLRSLCNCRPWFYLKRSNFFEWWK